MPQFPGLGLRAPLSSKGGSSGSQTLNEVKGSGLDTSSPAESRVQVWRAQAACGALALPLAGPPAPPLGEQGTSHSRTRASSTLRGAVLLSRPPLPCISPSWIHFYGNTFSKL